MISFIYLLFFQLSIPVEDWNESMESKYNFTIQIDSAFHRGTREIIKNQMIETIWWGERPTITTYARVDMITEH